MASINLQGDTSGSISISAPSVAGSNTLTLPATSQTLATQNALGVRNLIINGDMRIDQRNAGSAITSHAGFAVDRYRLLTTAGGAVSLQQSTDAPENASYSLKFTVTTGATPSSGVTAITQSIEGNNVAHLKLGTANAKTVTLSFWVKSSVTGTYSMSLMNGAANRSYVHEYTINAANTWEKKTVTLTGDTTGTWAVNNTTGFRIDWNLGSDSAYYSSTLDTWFGGSYTIGSTNDNNLLINTGATWQISLIQLEVGDTATPFEHRPYDMELQRCQRYYYKLASGDLATLGTGVYYGSTDLRVFGNFPVTMRAKPSIDSTTGTDYYNMVRSGINDYFTTINVSGLITNNVYHLYNVTEVSGTSGDTGIARTSNVNAYVAFDSEL